MTLLSFENRMMDLKTYVSTHRDHFLLSIIAIVAFSCFHLTSDLAPLQELIFTTSDSQTYYQVSEWILTGNDTESLSTRPLLYPFVLMLILKIGGESALFYVQTSFWLCALNFTFSSLRNTWNNQTIAWIGASIFMGNLSLMALTAHALTEVLTVLVISILVYILTKYRKQYKNVTFGLKIIAVFVVLTLIKPVFYWPTISVVFYSLVFYRKSLFSRLKNLVFLVLIILPMIGQMSLVYSKFGKFTVSTIGSLTFSRYFVAQGIAEIESINRPSAIEKSTQFHDTEKWDYLKKNRSFYFKLFRKNIRENIKGVPMYLQYPGLPQKSNLELFMMHFNHVSFISHVILLFVGFFVLLFKLTEKEFNFFIPFSLLYVLNLYLLFASGISYLQGDRLTITNIAIWAFLYPTLLFAFFQSIKRISDKQV